MRLNRRLLLILLFATLINTACMGLRVDVPLLAIHLGASTLTVGVLMGMFGVLPALFSVQSGRWIDRVGTARPMLVSAAAMTLCMLGGWLYPTLPMLFVMTPLYSLAFTMFTLSNYAAVAAIGAPEERSANFSWLSMTGGIANAVGPIIAGYMIDGLGHGATFALLAAGPALTAAVILVLRQQRAAPPATARKEPAGRAFDLMRRPQVVGPLIAGAVISLGFDVFSFLVPVYGSSINLPASAIGNIVGAMGVSVMLVRLFMPLVVRVFKPWQLVYGNLLLGAAVFLVFPFASALLLLVLLSLVYGVTYGILQPVLTALLADAAPAGRGGEALGLRFTLQNGIHAVIPALFGVVGALLGTLPAFWCVGALMAAAGWTARAKWSKA